MNGGRNAVVVDAIPYFGIPLVADMADVGVIVTKATVWFALLAYFVASGLGYLWPELRQVGL